MRTKWSLNQIVEGEPQEGMNPEALRQALGGGADAALWAYGGQGEEEEVGEDWNYENGEDSDREKRGLLQAQAIKKAASLAFQEASKQANKKALRDAELADRGLQLPQGGM